MKQYRLAIAAAVAVSAVATGVVIVAADGHDDSLGTAMGEVILAQGSDHLPSATASDWVTYADHVVAVTAVAETEIRPDQEALDRGEGMIGRTVKLEVDEVIWSRPDAPKPAPTAWERTSMGWQFTEGDTDNRVKLANTQSSRIEVGHSYITAIVWECSEAGKGKWHGLGEGSTVPFDNATIGDGELEGRVQSGDEAAKERESGSNLTLEAELAGRGAGDLRSALANAKPGPHEFGGRSTQKCD